MDYIEYEEMLFNNEAELKKFLISQNKDLKRKLENINADLSRHAEVNRLLNHYGKEKLFEIIFQSKKTKNQEKVDLLEKLRERLNNKTELIEFSDYYSQSVITTWNVCETINEMILEILREN